MAIDFDKRAKVYEKLYTTDEERVLAYAYLKRRYRLGLLKPIDGWDGDLVEGYASILGVLP